MNREIAIRLIKTKKLQIKQMLEIAKQIDNGPVHTVMGFTPMKKIIIDSLRLDELNQKSLIKIGHEAQDEIIWESIIQELKLKSKSITELFKIGEEAKSWQIWKAIVKTNKLNAEQLLDIGIRTNHVLVWDSIISTSKLTSNQVLNIGIRMHDEGNSIWNTVDEHLSLDDLTTDQIIELGKKRNDRFLWIDVLNSRKLSQEQLLDLWNHTNSFQVWREIIDQLELNNISSGMLMNLGKISNDWVVWNKIIRSSNLIVEQLFEIGNLIDKKEVWEEILQQL